MARRKRPVLFELVSRSQRPRGWTATSRSERDARAPMVPATTTRPSPPPRPMETDSAESVTSSSGGGQWHLTVGWPHLIVAAVFLAALLFGAFEAGKRSAKPPGEAPDDASFLTGDATLSEPPPNEPTRSPTSLRPAGSGAEVPTGRGEPAEREPEPPPPTPEDFRPPASFEFEEGQYYVIAQFFRRSDKAAADAARTFLLSKGIECIVHRGPQRDWWLVATQAFPNSSAASSLIRKVKEAGSEFAKSGGGYDFAGSAARKF